MSSMKVLLALLAILSTAQATGVSSRGRGRRSTPSCLAVAQRSCPGVAKLVLQSPETVRLLNASSSYTILCPSDRALRSAKIPSTLSIADLLSYHVVVSSLNSKKISSGASLVTALNGKKLTARRGRRSLLIRGDRSSGFVTQADLKCDKGYVHIINNVLIPAGPPCTTVYAALNATADLSILKAVVDAAGVADLLKNPALVGTVFAPTNAAFTTLLSALNVTVESALTNKDLLLTVLSNHVVPNLALKSSQLRNNTSLKTLLKTTLIVNVQNGIVSVRSRGALGRPSVVVQANITTCKAIVHMIDQVLVPVLPSAPPCITVYGALNRTKNLSILKAAVDAAGLTSTLNNPDFVGTVFAPTDSAFKSLLKSLKVDLATVVADKNLLLAVLTNHVVPNVTAFSNQLKNNQKLTTASNRTLIVSLSRRNVYVRSENARVAYKVLTPNVRTCKSVVHVIAGVLIPTEPKNRRSPSPAPFITTPNGASPASPPPAQGVSPSPVSQSPPTTGSPPVSQSPPITTTVSPSPVSQSPPNTQGASPSPPKNY